MSQSRVKRKLPLLKGPVTFTLDSGVARKREAPDSFYLPSSKRRGQLKVGDLAKIIFRITNGKSEFAERMWVVVTKVDAKHYLGDLTNQPHCTKEIKPGHGVAFEPRHVIDIIEAEKWEEMKG